VEIRDLEKKVEQQHQTIENLERIRDNQKKVALESDETVNNNVTLYLRLSRVEVG